GPKRNAYLRSWVDRRAVFEGVWTQDVIQSQEGNDLAIFWIRYLPEADTFDVHGDAYSRNGRAFARWRSTQVFFDRQGLVITYLWQGDQLDKPTPAEEKSGYTRLELDASGTLSQPTSGYGKVIHLGEKLGVPFKTRRVTDAMLSELGLGFTVDSL